MSKNEPKLRYCSRKFEFKCARKVDDVKFWAIILMQKLRSAQKIYGDATD